MSFRKDATSSNLASFRAIHPVLYPNGSGPVATPGLLFWPSRVPRNRPTAPARIVRRSFITWRPIPTLVGATIVILIVLMMPFLRFQTSRTCLPRVRVPLKVPPFASPSQVSQIRRMRGRPVNESFNKSGLENPARQKSEQIPMFTSSGHHWWNREA